MTEFDWIGPSFWSESLNGPDGGAYSGEGPLCFRHRQCFVAFDLETTGLDPVHEEIVEIGALKFDALGLIGKFSTLINPGKAMPPGATKVNGIDDAMLKDKPFLDVILPRFLRFIEGSVLIAHNAQFDLSFVNQALTTRFNAQKAPQDRLQASLLDDEEDPLEEKQRSIKVPFPTLPNKIIDTLALSRKVWPNRQKYSLQVLATEFGLNAIDAHRAEDDARVCMDLFLRCVETRFPRETYIQSNEGTTA